MERILIVDDEERIRELVRMNLELVGYSCFEADDGDKATSMIDEVKPNLVLLDIMLPNKTGYEIAPYFIEKNIPVIFLTAKYSVVDKVKGLKLGADDYISKPFETIELVARVESVLRRSQKNSSRISNTFSYKDIDINFEKREVYLSKNKIDITAQEFALLDILIKNKNVALSREKLLETAWGYDYVGDTRTIDMHIQKLRKKLNWDDVIITIYKYGYKLEIED